MGTSRHSIIAVRRVMAHIMIGLGGFLLAAWVGGCAPAPTPAPTPVPLTIVPSPTPILEVKPDFDSYCRKKYGLPNAYATVLAVYTTKGASSAWFCVVNPQDHMTGKRPINMFDVCASFQSTRRPLMKNPSDPNSWMCGSTATSTLPIATPAPTLMSVIKTPSSTSVPAPTLMSVIKTPSPTSVPAPILTSVINTPSPTSVPASTLPSPTAPPPPPGVYVTRIRIEPPNPNIVEDIRFFVTFWNTAGPLQFKWCVYIYNTGAQNPRGQTTCDTLIDFPLGVYEYATRNTWKLGPGTPCTDLVARVQGIETNGARLIFKTLDFSENSFSFRVCP